MQITTVRTVASPVDSLGRREHIIAPLATDSSACHVQAGDVGLPLACRNCAGLPVRRVSLYIICWSALSALSYLPDMCTSSCTQWLRCSLFCHCRSEFVEQSAAAASVLNKVEDVFVLGDGDLGALWQIVKSAVYKYAHLLTYYLNYNSN